MKEYVGDIISKSKKAQEQDGFGNKIKYQAANVYPWHKSLQPAKK